MVIVLCIKKAGADGQNNKKASCDDWREEVVRLTMSEG